MKSAVLYYFAIPCILDDELKMFQQILIFEVIPDYHHYDSYLYCAAVNLLSYYNTTYMLQGF